jgi:hypothetical protein
MHVAHDSSLVELERLGDEIATLAADLHAVTYRLLTRVREFDTRGGWGRGFPSCAQWLSWRTGIAPGAAREKVRVAHAIAELPRISAAMETGELSYSKVRALTRIATPETEERLLELARNATAAQVETVVRAWRRVDRWAEAEAEARRHEARHLTVLVDDDGSYVIRGRLDSEVGALFQRALEAAAKQLYVAGEASVPSVAGLEAPVPALPTAAQRRADALGLLVELALAGPELTPDTTPETAPSGRGVRPLQAAARVQVVLHVDAEGLRAESDAGQAVLDDGVRVPAETSRRLACDASRVVMTHDAAGNVLDVGRRTRTIPPAIRRALAHRDRGCRFPGCHNRYADAHHLRHWADGGLTSLDNLVLLCRRHHRAVHEDGYRVTVAVDGELTFRRPDGAVLPPVPRMPTSPHTWLTEGRRVAEAPYERLDLDWTIYMLYQPRIMREN